MDAHEFYQMLVVSRITTPQEKYDLVSEFKNYIKKNVIKSPDDGVLFLTSLTHILQPLSSKELPFIKDELTIITFSALGHIVKRMAAQSDGVTLATFPYAIQCFIDICEKSDPSKLALQYKSQIRNWIIDLWLSIPVKLEVWFRNYMSEHSNYGSLYSSWPAFGEIFKIFKEICEKYSTTFDISQYYVQFCSTYQFLRQRSSMGQNPFIIEAIENCNWLVRFSFRQNQFNRQNFRKMATKNGLDNDFIDDLINNEKSKEYSDYDGLVVQKDSRHELSVHRSVTEEQQQSHNNSHPSTKTNVNTDSELRDILFSLPSYSLEKISASEFLDVNSLINSTKGLEKDFEGRETEFNWSKREKHITKLRSMIRSSLFVNSNDNQKDFLMFFKDSLIDGVNKAINSLRTTLSTKGCKFIKELFQIFNINNFDNSTIELIFKNIMKLTTTTKKINNNNANVVIYAMLNKIFGLRSFNFKILNLIYDYSNEKNVSPRAFSSNWLSIIILKHPLNLNNFNDHGTFSSSSNESNAFKIVEKIIEKNLSDPSPLVRETSRKTFWILYKYYPRESQLIHDRLAPSVIKLLDRTRPKDVLGVNANRPSSRSQSALGSRTDSKHASYIGLGPDRSKALAKSRSVSDSSMPIARSQSLTRTSNTLSSTYEKPENLNGGSINPGIGKPIRLNRKPYAFPSSHETSSSSLHSDTSISNLNNNPTKNTRSKLHSSLGSRFNSLFSTQRSVSLENKPISSAGSSLDFGDSIIKPIELFVPQKSDDENISSKEDTDSEINNSMAKKLSLNAHEGDETSMKDGEKVSQEPIGSADNNDIQMIDSGESAVDKLSRQLRSHSIADQTKGINFFIELIEKQNIEFSLSDHSILTTSLNKVSKSSPQLLYPLVSSVLIPKVIDLIQLDDYLSVLCHYNMSHKGSITDVLNELISLLTFDEVVNNFIKLMKSNPDFVKFGLTHLKYLLDDNKVGKLSTNKQFILDKIILNLLMIWEQHEFQSNSEGVQLVKNDLVFLESQYASGFKSFVRDNFEKESGKSKNVLIHKDRYQLGGFIGKRFKSKSSLGEKSEKAAQNTSNSTFIDSSVNTSSNINFSISVDNDPAKDITDDVRHEEGKSSPTSPNRNATQNFTFSPLKDVDYGLSPVKISDLGVNYMKADDDLDLLIADEEDELGGYRNEMTKIVPVFKTSADGNEISFQEEKAPEAIKLSPKEAAKIDDIIEKVDPLKSIGGAVKKIPVYQDHHDINDIYDNLFEDQIKKYKLIHYKYNNLSIFDKSLENNLFMKADITHIKVILEHLSNGTLYLKESSSLIFVLDNVAKDLQNGNSISQIGEWICKKQGFDEIFKSISDFVDKKSVSDIFNPCFVEIFMVVRLLIKLSNEDNNREDISNGLFDSDKLGQYWLISEKIIDGLCLAKVDSSILSEKLISLMNDIVNELSSKGVVHRDSLLKNIVKSFKDSRENNSNKIKDKYRLDSISKSLMNSIDLVDFSESHGLLVDIEEIITRYLVNEEAEIRKEAILIYSMLFKIYKNNCGDASKMVHYLSLEPSQQKLITYYSECI
ncbi:Stu1 protein [Saccharomycopsis crataegensis]|uniref:Protein STU1 n=1 Tax=Saccharomycopsis crataegensis TaxID=43959 RepID=A0AAV5QHL9_9ASCO|nr:Stu1 protein [Saccharomycopsis crataegensis]